MLRTNLSTRPFYNERAVHVAAGVVAVLAIAVAAWQVVRIVRFSQHKTDLNAVVTKDRAEAEKNEREAAQILGKLDKKEVAQVTAAATEANDLINQRTFSWTQLFNELQATMPEDVMLMTIRPEFKDGVTTLTFDLQGKTAEDISDFWEHLEKIGTFHDVVWSTVQVTEQGFQRIQMKAVYTSHAPVPQNATTIPAPVPAPEPAAAENPAAAPPAAAASAQPGRGRGRGGR
ncbi:MAG TPA: PilN domain-containing protein [Vicinamibacterales bacterium]|nr:PilN domain-containing protein [Vicinamibacterales bacterium]